ncbi:hypothetical protein [Methylocystis iwaonis]|uniref:hypothetical protein n=1 Tax=Methylocystis iwaonis TaxID=2885079 RepID=UPI002E7AD22D|nr:hypothetical protein [Methylocystis iwaonis]
MSGGVEIFDLNLQTFVLEEAFVGRDKKRRGAIQTHSSEAQHGRFRPCDAGQGESGRDDRSIEISTTNHNALPREWERTIAKKILIAISVLFMCCIVATYGNSFSVSVAARSCGPRDAKLAACALAAKGFSRIGQNIDGKCLRKWSRLAATPKSGMIA